MQKEIINSSCGCCKDVWNCGKNVKELEDVITKMKALLYRSCSLLCNADREWSEADIEFGQDIKYSEACRNLNNEIHEFLKARE